MDETEDREALMNSASTATIVPPVDNAEESGFSWWKLFTGQLFTKSIARDEAERAAEVAEDRDQGAVDPDGLEHEDGAGQAGPDVPVPDLDLSDTTELALADGVPPLPDLEVAEQNELDPLEDEVVELGLGESEPTATVDPQLSVDVELETAVDDLETTDSVVDQPDTTVALDTAGPAVALMEVDEPDVDESSLEEGQDELGGQALADDSVATDPRVDLGIDDSVASTEPAIDEPEPDPTETELSELAVEVADPVIGDPEPEVTEPAAEVARPPADPHDEMTERWVDELRSGRHQQLCGAWEDTGFFGGHSECTIQVAKNTFNVDLGELTDRYGQPFISEILRRNDHEHQSFKRIADYIEETQLKGRRRELEMER
jgi:hypothetical protein